MNYCTRVINYYLIHMRSILMTQKEVIELFPFIMYYSRKLDNYQLLYCLSYTYIAIYAKTITRPVQSHRSENP